MFFKKKKESTKSEEPPKAARPQAVSFQNTTALEQQQKEVFESQRDPKSSNPLKTLTFKSNRLWGRTPEDVIKVDDQTIYWVTRRSPMSKPDDTSSFIEIMSTGPNGPTQAVVRIRDESEDFSPQRRWKPKEAFRFALTTDPDFDPDPKNWSTVMSMAGPADYGGPPFSFWMSGRTYAWKSTRTHSEPGIKTWKLVDVEAKDLLVAVYHDEPNGAKGLWARLKLFIELTDEAELICLITMLGFRQIMANVRKSRERGGGAVGSMLGGILS